MLAKLTVFAHRLSKWFEWVAVAGLMGVLVFTCVDVVGAKLFHAPIRGGIEIVVMIQLIAIAAALSITKVANLHINIEVLINVVNKRTKAVLNSITSFLGLGLFIILAWKSYELSVDFLTCGRVSGTAEVPYYPFAFMIPLSCIPICLVLLSELLKNISELAQK